MANYGTYNTPGGFKLTVYGIVIAVCFLMMFYIVRGMYIENNPGRVNSARAAERIKARNELREKTSTRCSRAERSIRTKDSFGFPSLARCK